ncbi:MAG: DUF4197 domain-containing protein [Bacteroidales bacterium]|jgi:hypothetical protein|nr:DUF4197 domain-containing protein [Bacteroidales bacterium]
MKKTIAILSIIILFVSCDVLTGVLGEMETSGTGPKQLTQAEVSQGLKEALNVGVGKAVNMVSATNGFYNNPQIKIPFPEEAVKVKEFCINAGLKNQVTQFEEKLNRAAEDASKGAIEVFVNSIKQMSISDAISILQGKENAATEYFKRTSSKQLYDKFYPVVSASTDKIMLAKYWTPLVDKYNTAMMITGGQKVETDLNAYVTNKALDGLFLMLAKEEKNIRVDPIARVTDILTKVFGSDLNPYNKK